MRGAAVHLILVHALIGFSCCAPQAAIELPFVAKPVRSCILCFARAGGAGRRCAGSPKCFFGVIAAQAAIEVPSAVQTCPKHVSFCILCFAGAGGCWAPLCR